MKPTQTHSRASARASVMATMSVALMHVACSGGSSTSGNTNAGAPSIGGSDGFGGTLTTSIGSSTLTAIGGAGGTRAPTSAGGGNTNTATPGTGGFRSTGGASVTGATSVPTVSGGVASTGGTPNAGGLKSSGGTRATGGVATDGTSAGRTSGGAASTGGASSISSANSTGGAQNAGGSKASGGTSASASGGLATGGASSSGTRPITIWMAGDSTMMDCASACPCGWGSEFGSYFNANVAVQNEAVGGRSVQTWLYEKAVTSTIGSNKECELSSETYDTRWTAMLSAMMPGDYLMIAFGINDGDPNCPRHVGSDRFKTLLDVMVKAAQGKGAFPILLTPTDAIECSGTTVTQKRGFLTETKAVGTSDNVPVIDLNQLSMDLYKKLGFCPNEADYTSTASNLGKFFCDDHTHFESAGANQIAGLVANALKTQGSGLAAYLK